MPALTSTLLYNWFEEVWNKENESYIDEHLSPDIIAYGIGPSGLTNGIDEFKVFYQQFRNQFSKIHVTVEQVISENDMECGRTTVEATDRQSGKEVRFAGAAIVKITDGKISEAWNFYDFLGMYLQLGLQLSAQ